MTAELIAKIQTFTLDARKLLEVEAHEQLEGLYGWLKDGSFNIADNYPALQLEEAAATRRMLEQYQQDEGAVGVSAVAARQKLIREVAFTWINRTVAFKMLEARQVLRRVIAPPERANAYLHWVAGSDDQALIRQHEAGDQPASPLHEGPRQQAYRHFILWQCGELAREMSVLFDPATLASRLFPRPPVLGKLVEKLNAEEIGAAWELENEETIGWVYQGFNSEEKAATFASFQAGKKITPAGIPAATGVFTPNWVVRYLVENTLGRLWLEMHPDSRLADKLTYLVPQRGKSKRPGKLAREITFLDPSCGSMHFGLVAFEVFAEIYREELERAGETGWPPKASVAAEADIATSILEHNLHGIDIDPRAVQVAALTLLIKARGLNRDARVTDRNLACCNVEALTGGRLEEVIGAAKLSTSIERRILQAMAEELQESENLGSLLRPERKLGHLIEEEYERAGSNLNMLPGLGDDDLFQLDTPEQRERYFENFSQNIETQLDQFVEQSGIGSHFSSETAKGLNFLRLVQKRYDVVVTNPPYLDSRDYNQVQKRFLDSYYPDSKRNYFTAFTERSLELTDTDGYMGLLTGQSFMFIKTYEGLRQQLRDNVMIVTLSQYDYHLFKERVDTVAFVFKREADAKRREESVGTYFRLVHERDAAAKCALFEEVVAELRAGSTHSRLFHYRQGDFDAITGAPWTYWAPEWARKAFRFKSIQDKKIATVKEGINTGDNFRFIRDWWEIPRETIGSGKRWMFFAKGNRSNRYWYPMTTIVNANIKEMSYLSGSAMRNLSYTGLPGISFLSNTPKRMCAWLTPEDHMFCSTGGRTIFPACQSDFLSLLGLVNSTVTNFLLKCINPTISIKVGDLLFLPIPETNSRRLDELVEECVALARQASGEDETTYDFVAPVAALAELGERQARLRQLEGEIDREVSRLYGLTESDLAAIEQELTAAATGGAADESDESAAAAEDDEAPAADLTAEEQGRQWISYAIGVVLGRFTPGVAGAIGRGNFDEATVAQVRGRVVAEGIAPCEEGHPHDLARRTWEVLELMRGEAEAAALVKAALGQGAPLALVRGWLERFTGQPAQSFWAYHFQRYRKRPAYWPLQSPVRRYTVWLFHERLTADTLGRVRHQIVEPRQRLISNRADELRERAEKDRTVARERDRLLAELHDLNTMLAKFAEIKSYQPEIDDGVLLNAAPLHPLLPAWREAGAAWSDLEKGKFDWAQQAMHYWPERVREACATNRSFAIAHGMDEGERTR